MFRGKLFRWEYLPSAVALIAAGVLLLSPYVSADPAILKGANGVACQIPNNQYDPATTQLDFTPADENDVLIYTHPSLYGVRADGVCFNIDKQVKPAFINQLNIMLPYVVSYNSLKGKTKTWCRMEDSDNNVYFTRKWRSLLKIEQVAPNNVKITKLIICADGRQK